MGLDQHDHEGRLITLEYEQFSWCAVIPQLPERAQALDYRMTWEDDLREYLMELDRRKR